ncbi:putative proline-rich receptor-like protein kinase PERK8 [Iris pallida]|uniref:Proline-rich receptor-like protein kinase PERK8 n=1 Tax=Iris pallida TaxID=29817 RepID=A0AAX6ILF6_IRIPA|nr:putative proline-rich receptor-like protein kinase PERK8 [Iris pallida]
MMTMDRRLGKDRGRSEGDARWSMGQPTPDLDSEDDRSPSGPRESMVDEGRVEALGAKIRAELDTDSLAAGSSSPGRLLLTHWCCHSLGGVSRKEGTEAALRR